MSEDISEELLEDLYAWVDHIPLSRPKKDIRRDFADGVLVAEIVQYFLPNLVDLNNFVSSSNTQQKKINWTILNRKVFQKLHFEVRDDVIENIVQCKPWAVEHFLMLLRRKIDRQLYESKRTMQQDQPTPSGPTTQPHKYSDRPEVDQWTEATSPTIQGSNFKQGFTNQTRGPAKSQSQQSLTKGTVDSQRPPGQTYRGQGQRSDKVPRIEVEEIEQEILARDETVQILEAKVRRLEQLLHLKDIRLDDLQTRLDRMETDKRPTAQVPAHGHPQTHSVTRGHKGPQSRR